MFVLIADLQDRIGFPDWGLGAVVATSFLVSFGAEVSLARYADRGHARLLLAIGLALAAVGMVGFTVGGSLAALVATRHRCLGGGVFLPAARRIVASASPGREAEVLGRLGSAEVGGFIAGPPVAALVAGLAGLRAPFLLFAVLVLAVGPVLVVIGEPVPDPDSRPGAVLGVLLRTPGVRAGLEDHRRRPLHDDRCLRGAVVALPGRPRGVHHPRRRLAPAVRPSTVRIRSGAGWPIASGPSPRPGFAALLCGLPLIVAYGQTRLLWLLVVIAVVHAGVDSVTMPSGLGAVARATPPGLMAAGQGLYGRCARWPRPSGRPAPRLLRRSRGELGLAGGRADGRGHRRGRPAPRGSPVRSLRLDRTIGRRPRTAPRVA